MLSCGEMGGHVMETSAAGAWGNETETRPGRGGNGRTSRGIHILLLRPRRRRRTSAVAPCRPGRARRSGFLCFGSWGCTAAARACSDHVPGPHGGCRRLYRRTNECQVTGQQARSKKQLTSRDTQPEDLFFLVWRGRIYHCPALYHVHGSFSTAAISGQSIRVRERRRRTTRRRRTRESSGGR